MLLCCCVVVNLLLRFDARCINRARMLGRFRLTFTPKPSSLLLCNLSLLLLSQVRLGRQQQRPNPRTPRSRPPLAVRSLHRASSPTTRSFSSSNSFYVHVTGARFLVATSPALTPRSLLLVCKTLRSSPVRHARDASFYPPSPTESNPATFKTAERAPPLITLAAPPLVTLVPTRLAAGAHGSSSSSSSSAADDAAALAASWLGQTWRADGANALCIAPVLKIEAGGCEFFICVVCRRLTLLFRSFLQARRLLCCCPPRQWSPSSSSR